MLFTLLLLLMPSVKHFKRSVPNTWTFIYILPDNLHVISILCSIFEAWFLKTTSAKLTNNFKTLTVLPRHVLVPLGVIHIYAKFMTNNIDEIPHFIFSSGFQFSVISDYLMKTFSYQISRDVNIHNHTFLLFVFIWIANAIFNMLFLCRIFFQPLKLC